MSINIGYDVILAFHNFHLRGQTNVAFIKIYTYMYVYNTLFYQALFQYIIKGKCQYFILCSFHIGGQTNTIFVHFSCISRVQILGPIKMENIIFWFSFYRFYKFCWFLYVIFFDVNLIRYLYEMYIKCIALTIVWNI